MRMLRGMMIVEQPEQTATDGKQVGEDLPLDIASKLLGTKWETPLDQLKPRPRN